VTDIFGTGDHLRVWRGLYFHHGIYTGDNIVVQFGGRVLDKRHARISEVPIAEFERCGRGRLVEHGVHKWPGIYDLPPADSVERIVARAPGLVKHSPPGTYSIFGRNCESIANWCVCGYGESNQWKRGQGLVTLLVDVPLTLLISYRMRWRRDDPEVPLPKLALAVMAGRSVSTAMYYWHNNRFYDFVRGVPELRTLMRPESRP
jgi:hypothetical protein